MNRVKRRDLLGGRHHLVFLALAVVGLLFGASSVRAGGCGDTGRAGVPPLMPFLAHPGSHDAQPPTIVGLWHVVYTAADGSPFNQSFKMWHADGIEFENAFLPPSGGNICFGVWKDLGHGRVKLHHVGLIFDSGGTLTNTFTVDELNNLAPDGMTYKGNFDFKVYDLSGHMLQEVKGTAAATRITVD